MNNKKFLHRDILPEIRKQLDTPYVVILIGSRRTGKTTLLKMLMEEPTVRENRLYFDLENPLYRQNFHQLDYDRIARQLLHTLPKPDRRGYIFLDEIQYLENSASLLKYMFDHYPQLKFIVSGSSSLRIKSLFSDSMVGRKRVVRLYPLNFREFLRFKQKEELLRLIQNMDVFSHQFTPPELLPSHRQELLTELLDFLRFGGYPETTLLKQDEERIQSLYEIYTSYIQKDIAFLFSIEHVEKFNKLVQILAAQIGNLVNMVELTNTVGLARSTIERYTFILENTFVLRFLLPHYSNIRKELSKMPKVFFEDVGLCNAVRGRFLLAPEDAFIGQLAENFVLNELEKRYRFQIKFWRNKNKQEVDFVLFEGGETIPVEVKFQAQRRFRIPMGLKSFIRAYHPRRALVITRDYSEVAQWNNTEIIFMPIYLI